jgi:hypothetical protein
VEPRKEEEEEEEEEVFREETRRQETLNLLIASIFQINLGTLLLVIRVNTRTLPQTCGLSCMCYPEYTNSVE